MRKLAVDFLTLSTRDQLLAVFVANRLRPTEAGYIIADVLDVIEATLAKPTEERDAELAAVALDADRRLAPFAHILSQIDPARRGIFTQYTDGHATYEAADAATARSATCRTIEGSERLRQIYAGKTNRKSKTQVEQPAQPRKFCGIISRRVNTCHNCKRGVGDHCIYCKRVNQDEIRMMKATHNVNPGLTKDPKTENADAQTQEPATNLQPNVEDVLRVMFATFANLPPIGVLAVVHRATKRAEPFAEYLQNFLAKMRTYLKGGQGHAMNRATLKAAWDRTAAKNPAFAALQTWSGHGGRMSENEKAEAVRQEIDDAETQDHSRDRDEPFDDDRDEDTTRYFFDDGSGTDW